MDKNKEYKSGIELGYSARNSRSKCDTIDYVHKLFDEDKENDPVGVYEYMMDCQGKLLRKELGINLVDLLKEKDDEDASEDQTGYGPFPHEGEGVHGLSNAIPSSGDDIPSGDIKEQDMPIQSVSDGGSDKGGLWPFK